MSADTIEIANLVEQCAWCGMQPDADMRVVIAGGRFSTWSPRVEMMRGHVVRVGTSRGAHPVTAVVPLVDTPAHCAGYDLLFVLCSINCRDALDAAIGEQPMTISRETVKARSENVLEHRAPPRRRPS